MKLQFKHQKFQADAAKAVVDVFAGQPCLSTSYMIDRGDGEFQLGLNEERDFTGWRNHKLVPELTDSHILERIRKIQRTNQIKPSDKLEGRYNLTIEMETGVGKTYTYIKTMYELNKAYGWSKFIVYSVALTALFCLVFFALEAFNFFNWVYWLECAGASTLLTMILVIAIESVRRQ